MRRPAVEEAKARFTNGWRKWLAWFFSARPHSASPCTRRRGLAKAAHQEEPLLGHANDPLLGRRLVVGEVADDDALSNDHSSHCRNLI
jgi:hypothetical protein